MVPALSSRDLDHILIHTDGLWNELRGQRLFITGGTGFFGCWLLESFAWANDHLGLNASVLVLTRNPEGFRKKAPHLAEYPAIHFHVGDVRTFDFPPGEFSHVIHAAAKPNPTRNDEDALTTFATIVDGTKRTLELARQCGAKKLLLTSSGAVYGKQPSDLTHIPEAYTGAPDSTEPRSAYGEGKRAAEQLSVLFSRQCGMEVKIARCFAFVGPYLPLDIHYAIGNFIRDRLKAGPIRVNGDGTPYRSYLYAADLSIWLWTILFRGTSCRPYNVGSEQALSIRSLAEMFAQLATPPLEVQLAHEPKPGQDPERYVPSTQRARTELGLDPCITLPEAIRRTVAWHVRKED